MVAWDDFRIKLPSEARNNGTVTILLWNHNRSVTGNRKLPLLAPLQFRGRLLPSVCFQQWPGNPLRVALRRFWRNWPLRPVPKPGCNPANLVAFHVTADSRACGLTSKIEPRLQNRKNSQAGSNPATALTMLPSRAEINQTEPMIRWRPLTEMDTVMRFLLLAGVLFLAVSAECRASVIFSDDFEAEQVPPDPPGYLGGYSSFLNWDVIGPGLDLVGPGSLWPPRIDSLMVDLDGNSGSTLITKQTFSLLPGTYTLTFELGGPVGGKAIDNVQVDVGAIFGELFTIQRGDPSIFISRTITVTAASSGKLSFTDLGADSNGAFLDDVSIDFTPATVPEPSSLALLGVGVLGMACRLIRRRRNAYR